MKIKFICNSETILELDTISLDDEQEAKVVALKGMEIISYHFSFKEGTKLGDTESLKELASPEFMEEITITLKA